MKNKYLILLLASALMILYYGRIDISQAPFSDIPDIQNYRQMALAAPGFDETVSRNFGYRILIPYIAGSLPFDIDTNFYLLTLILSLIIPMILYKFLKTYGLKSDTSFYLTLLFLAGRHTFGFPSWDFYDIHDLLTHILILLFFIALKKDNFIIMTFLLIVGVTNRETILFIVPGALFYYIFMRKEKNNSIRMIISVLPALIILIIIRSFITTESSESTAFLYSLGKLRFDESNKMFNPVTYYRIINTFIPLTLIPFVFFKITKEFFKKNIHFLIFILIYYSSCFLAGDTERLIVPMFPVFFLLLGIIFEEIEFNSLKNRILILMLCILTIPHHMYFRYRLPSREWKVVISLFTLIVVTAFFIKLKKERSNVLDSNSDI